MAFQKTIQKILNDDRRAITFTISNGDDGYAGQLKCLVLLDGSQGPGQADVVSFTCTGPLQNAGLSGAQRAALVDALTTIYDTAKTSAGYVDVP